MVGALALAGMLAGCGPRRGTELNNDWFIGDWAPSRACTPSEFTSFLRDGSYTAPMNATRRGPQPAIIPASASAPTIIATLIENPLPPISKG